MRFSAVGRGSWRGAGRALLPFLLLVFPLISRAADAGISDGGVPAADANEIDGGAPALDPRPEQIRALIAGTLPVNVEPQSLFAVPVTDEPAQQVERVR